MTPHQPLVAVTREVPGVLEIPGAEVRTLGPGLAGREDLLRFVEGASVVVSMYTDRVDDELLDRAGPGLRAVCNFAVGYDNIDTAACARRGIAVTNTPDAVTEGTANMAWLLALAVARRLVVADRYARSEAYPDRGSLGMAEFLGMDLTGKTLLVIGAGRIGYATALRSLSLGMRVIYVSRSRKLVFELAPVHARRAELDEALPEADVVSIHCPLTPETAHLINAERIARMKPSAILVNTARGPIVDETALARARQAGHLWGVGLDVHEREPRINPELAATENVIVTPHIGSAEIRYRELMTRMVQENARAILEGRAAPNRVV